MQSLQVSLNPEATQSPGGGGYINSGQSGYSSPLPADVSNFSQKSAVETITGAKSFGNVGFFGTAALAAKPTALTAQTAVAPAGGAGVAAGAWSTAVDRDAAITLINNLRTRVGELETKLRSLGLLT
jgi:hypothetical protein